MINHFRHNRMIAKVNMYVYLKFGENYSTNMGDMEKVYFFNSCSSCHSHSSACISKTEIGACLNFAHK